MLSPSHQEIEAAVHAAIHELLEERGQTPPPLHPDQRLNADLTLDSLDLATLVARLEVTLGLDPFARLVPVTSLRTVGDVVTAYRREAAGEQPREDDGLAEAARRGAARRSRRGPG
jgi:acyl carrier protein